MGKKELFNGTPITTISDDEKLALGKPNVEGSKVISWAAFKAFFATLYVGITGTQTISGDKTFTGSTKVNTPTVDDEIATKGYVDNFDLPDKMDKLSNPTKAQRISFLGINADGQAEVSNLSYIRDEADFVAFMAAGVNKTGLLLEDINLAGYYTLNGGVKRIIGEGTKINLTDDTTFGFLVGVTMIIEPTIHATTDIKFGISPNNTDYKLYANYITSATGSIEFGKVGSGDVLLGDVRLLYSNTTCELNNASTNPFTAISLNTDYFSSGTGTVREQTTGTTITFDRERVYNTALFPADNLPSGGEADITFDQTNAKLGVVQKIYIRGHTPQFLGVPSVKVGFGEFDPGTPGVVNIIFCEWTENNRIEYWIVQES